MKTPQEPETTPLLRAPKPQGAASQAAPPGGLGGYPSNWQIPRQSLAKRLISFPALLGGLLVAGLFVPLREFDVDPDLWWHIKVGQNILTTHHFPTVDANSFTVHGTPWMAYEWLGDVLLGAAHRAGGLRGLLALDVVLGAAILIALYAFVSLRTRNSKAAFAACALLLPLVFVSLTLRPQMLGYCFLILTLIVLERFRQGRSATLWLAPPLLLVWVNTHGSFVVGLFAFGVYGISGLFKLRWGGLESTPWTPAQRLRLGSAFLLSLSVLAITPYGVRLAGYPIDMAFFQPMNVAHIQEWEPMPFNQPFGQYFLALLAAFLLAQVVLRPTWQLAELTLFLAGLLAACLHTRFLLVFVPFSAPLFGTILSRWVPPYQPGKDKYALNALLMAAIVAGIIRFFPSREQLERHVARHSPVEAVQYILRHPPPQPMYNNYEFGGYLIFALDGRNKVFVDGRTDIYERAGVLADYASIAGVSPNSLPLLRAYNVQSCLLEHGEALATLLAASSQWQKIYADGLSVLFVRSQTGKWNLETGKLKTENRKPKIESGMSNVE